MSWSLLYEEFSEIFAQPIKSPPCTKVFLIPQSQHIENKTLPKPLLPWFKNFSTNRYFTTTRQHYEMVYKSLKCDWNPTFFQQETRKHCDNGGIDNVFGYFEFYAVLFAAIEISGETSPTTSSAAAASTREETVDIFVFASSNLNKWLCPASLQTPTVVCKSFLDPARKCEMVLKKSRTLPNSIQ
ncbi:hypothetical protein BDN70DRAFT_615568 [Pholiota conissans]|uniref:Uncharacterized protein n=1 Tax=Pholiota conissans TaxID=109636 RepID=A0A9P5YJK9_9AGAR|nr:hypothetical protein BDN70DRAFT_615568 [Pholiota conissans]